MNIICFLMNFVTYWRNKQKFEQESIFPIGTLNDAFAQYFIGQSYLAPISTDQMNFFNVTFEPGCRNNWHIHHATSGRSQMLVGVAGCGWYQEEGKPAAEILPGTGNTHSRQRETLAQGTERQLVLSPRL